MHVWTRAFQLNTARPCYKVSSANPGSDVAGEAAAALAASSIVFKEKNATYSSILLQHARELYAFANKHRGKYSDSIADAYKYYRSYSGFNDELIWAAAWLYKATKEPVYLDNAKKIPMEDSDEVSWDNKYGGAKILLADLTGDAKYIKEADDFCLKIVNKRPRTDQNMFFIQKWGSARHAANVAYACMTLNKYVPNGITNYKLIRQRTKLIFFLEMLAEVLLWDLETILHNFRTTQDHHVQKIFPHRATGMLIIVVNLIQIYFMEL